MDGSFVKLAEWLTVSCSCLVLGRSKLCLVSLSRSDRQRCHRAGFEHENICRCCRNDVASDKSGPAQLTQPRAALDVCTKDNWPTQHQKPTEIYVSLQLHRHFFTACKTQVWSESMPPTMSCDWPDSRWTDCKMTTRVGGKLEPLLSVAAAHFPSVCYIILLLYHSNVWFTIQCNESTAYVAKAKSSFPSIYNTRLFRILCFLNNFRCFGNHPSA